MKAIFAAEPRVWTGTQLRVIYEGGVLDGAALRAAHPPVRGELREALEYLTTVDQRRPVGDFIFHINRALAAVDPETAETDGLDVDVLADALTARHIQTAGGCSESHLDEARAIVAAYRGSR